MRTVVLAVLASISQDPALGQDSRPRDGGDLAGGAMQGVLAASDLPEAGGMRADILVGPSGVLFDYFPARGAFQPTLGVVLPISPAGLPLIDDPVITDPGADGGWGRPGGPAQGGHFPDDSPGGALGEPDAQGAAMFLRLLRSGLSLSF